MYKFLLFFAAIMVAPVTGFAEDGDRECVPECEGKVCGDDGCEGECGTCEEGETCTEAEEGGTVCEANCVPDCEGKTCGDDGCGSECGTCEDGEECVDGEEGAKACEEVCNPNCENKTCGDDGCGSPCGVCLVEEACLDSNCAPADCLGACDGTSPTGCQCDSSCYLFGDCCADVCVTCGICGPPAGETPVTDGCGQGSCAGCCDEFVLDAVCQCDASCVDYGDCCDDACSVCGVCEEVPEDEACPDWLGYEGCCLSTGDLAYCNSDGLWKGGPCPDGLGCGWNGDSGYYDCVSSPEADPEGAFPQWCSELPGFAGGTPKPDTTEPEEDVVTEDVTEATPDAESGEEGGEGEIEEEGGEGNTGDGSEPEGSEGDSGVEESLTDAGSVGSDTNETGGEEATSLASSDSGDDGCKASDTAPLGLALLFSLAIAFRRRNGVLGEME